MQVKIQELDIISVKLPDSISYVGKRFLIILNLIDSFNR